MFPIAIIPQLRCVYLLHRALRGVVKLGVGLRRQRDYGAQHEHSTYPLIPCVHSRYRHTRYAPITLETLVECSLKNVFKMTNLRLRYACMEQLARLEGPRNSAARLKDEVPRQAATTPAGERWMTRNVRESPVFQSCHFWISATEILPILIHAHTAFHTLLLTKTVHHRRWRQMRADLQWVPQSTAPKGPKHSDDRSSVCSSGSKIGSRLDSVNRREGTFQDVSKPEIHGMRTLHKERAFFGWWQVVSSETEGHATWDLQAQLRKRIRA